MWWSVNSALRSMVNNLLAPDSPVFQPYGVTRWDIGQFVRFDVERLRSYFLGMSDDTPKETSEMLEDPTLDGAAKGKVLSEPAKRALREAAERRKAKEDAAKRPTEQGGPSGEEPTRYGDWERGGIAYDF